MKQYSYILILLSAILSAILFTSCSKKNSIDNNNNNSPITGKSERIYDPNPGEGFGYSVAISNDGNTAVTGILDEDNNYGNAYVYIKNGTNWELQATLRGYTASADPITQTGQGISVDISADGNTIVMGARAYLSNQGASAFIFSRNGNNWTQAFAITSNQDELSCDTRNSVVISGDGRIVVVKGYDYQHNYASAIVYTKYSTGWEKTGIITPEQNYTTQVGSLAISYDGATLAVGKVYPHGAASNFDYDGKINVYRGTGAGWVGETFDIEPSNAADKYYFGQSISMSDDGNKMVVGTNPDNNAGAAYVYTQNLGLWLQFGDKLSADIDVTTYNHIASSVAISPNGNDIVINGNIKQVETDAPGTRKNIAFCYHFDNTNWIREGNYIVDNGSEGIEFLADYSLATSADGKTILAGSSGFINPDINTTGCIRFFYK